MVKSTTVRPHGSAALQLGLPPQGESVAARQRLRDKLGVCQWFHYEDYTAVERATQLLKELGVTHLRTGISWADFHRPNGKKWYDWQMGRLSESGLEVLLSVWHVPPSLSEGQACNAPPRRLDDYADFIEQVIIEYGQTWHHLELWNEPNNHYKWNFKQYDPHWAKFAQMVGEAARRAKKRGRHTVLGGMIPVDHHWLRLIESHGALDHIDIVAIHAFPEMWWPNHPNWEWYGQWQGWKQKLDYIGQHTKGRPIWVTETGLATWHIERRQECRHDLQAGLMNDLIAAPAQRIYFYSLVDLDPAREAIEGFHVDENEYHMGLVTYDGRKKPAFHRLRNLLSGVPASSATGSAEARIPNNAAKDASIKVLSEPISSASCSDCAI